MRFTPLLIVMLCYCQWAAANDGFMDGVGGSFVPMKGEHKSIRMVREHVRMTILPDLNYRVTVDFVFHNNGPATRVLMGFPERGGGVDMEPGSYKHSSGLKRFATWVDGRRVRARYVFHSGRWQGYHAHWIKRVCFARGQTRRVRVCYLASCGFDSGGGSSAHYDFTGGNWRGKVKESLVTVTFLVPGNHSVRGGIGTGRGAAHEHRHRNRLFYRHRNWEAEGEFSLDFKPMLRNPLAINSEKLSSYYYEDTIDLPDGRSVFRSNQSRKTALHSGMVVMEFRELGYWFNALEPKKKDRLMHSRKWRNVSGFDSYEYQRRNEFCHVEWRAGDRTAWLRAGIHVFGFRDGKARMVIDGKVLRLPAPPLKVLDRGQYALYVPLAPIIKALRGRIKVAPERRRVWVHL